MKNKSPPHYEREISEVRPRTYKKLSIISGVVIFVVILLFVFIIPQTYQKYSLYTDTATVQYNAQENYQETVNYDSCDNGAGCICTAHGGFLWLTCTQCSCTRQRTVVREKVVSVLKEKTESDSATLFQTLTDTRISEAEAKQTVQTLLTFISQKTGESAIVGTPFKEGNNWKVSLGNIYVIIDSNNGRILSVVNGNTVTSFDSFLREINSQ